MNITSAQYINDTFTNEPSGIKATIDGEVMFVPVADGNRHYQEIVRQIEAGDLVVEDA